MKIYLLSLTLLGSCLGLQAQNFSGNFESNSQYYMSSEEFGITAPQDRLRANNYFTLNFEMDGFTVGAQYEAYLPNGPLLGYDPTLNGNEIATYFGTYTRDEFSVTAGYFYEEFGNGLALRSWEDRQLGLNNALKGVRVKAKLAEKIYIKALFGKQRHGFETSEGSLQAADLSYELSESFSLGASAVSRYIPHTSPDSDYPTYVGLYGGRAAYDRGAWSVEGTYLWKSPDVRVVSGTEIPGNTFSGSGFQLDLGYAVKGFSISGQFRRIENFGFYTDREAYANQYNAQLVNYVPGLTKQQDYGLMNIYVYQAQPNLIIEQGKSGEIGAQFDMYYKFNKDSFLGKYRTKLALNYSNWSQLEATYDVADNSYESETFGRGDLLYQDFNFEVRNRWSKSWSSIVSFMNQYYNKGELEGGEAQINDQVLVMEATKKMAKRRSIKFDLQHLWTQDDLKNWVGFSAEYYMNGNWSVFARDLYNYGDEDQNHYFNTGVTYNKKATRLMASYGRQRGGLLCIGGVCRYVPENYGVSIGLTTSF